MSAVVSSQTGSQVAIGTMRGKVYLVNRFTGALEHKYEPHDKKITQVHIREGQSIITSSNDGTIFIQSLKPEKQSKRINLKEEYEISCFCLIDPNSDLEFVIGFGKGDLMYYKESMNLLFQTSVTKKVIHKSESKEGSIISCVFFKKVIVCSTS